MQGSKANIHRINTADQKSINLISMHRETWFLKKNTIDLMMKKEKTA